MSDYGPITSTFLQNMLTCIDTVQDDPQIAQILLQISSHLVQAINQLESQQRDLATITQDFSQNFKILNNTNTQLDNLARDTNPPERFHLPHTWDHRIAPDDLPRINKRNLPHITGTRAKWLPNTAFTIACAQAFGLPMPQQVGQKAGHPITARLATDTTTDAIFLVIGGYILNTLDDHTASIARHHMAATDSPCIEIDAKLTRGQDNTWRIIYYL